MAARPGRAAELWTAPENHARAGGNCRRMSTITSVSSSIATLPAVFGFVPQAPGELAAVRNVRAMRPKPDQLGVQQIANGADRRASRFTRRRFQFTEEAQDV